MTENNEDCEVVKLITEAKDKEDDEEDEEEVTNYVEKASVPVTCFRRGIRICILIGSAAVAAALMKLSWKYNTAGVITTPFPGALLGPDGVYSVEDFKDPLTGRSPRYWNDLFEEYDHKNSSTIPHWGPCYEPRQKLNEDDWKKSMLSHKWLESNNEVDYPLKQYNIEYRNINTAKAKSRYDENLSGLCRPGFLIIGVGKCGTSSLYRYLTGHPRVLPANMKQIHYFKYYITRSMRWYLSHFPTAESFLSSGALMTGEASPGYIPYPDVAVRLKNWMGQYAGDGHDPEDGHSPALIVIARDPLDRAYSSYKYSYVVPALKRLKLGKYSTALKGQPDAYYDDYIFSFEELMEAELMALKECLKPGGKGEIDAMESYNETWAVTEFERRKKEGLPHMVNIQLSCYGNRVSNEVPRAQWTNLVNTYPEKMINMPNIHLVEALIGRSLYTLPLDWYYALYPEKDIHLVCTEDLKRQPATTMSGVSDFLGLPSFNFTNVVNEGVYNAGARPGYDKVTSWQVGTEDFDIPISENLKEEVLAFFQPYNDRLFAITKKECEWM